MDSVLLRVLSYSEVREVLLYSLVDPSLFTEQTWKLLCKELLSASWLEYEHINEEPRRRFVEIAYRKGLQPAGLSLYSEEYMVLFAMFNRKLERFQGLIKKFPEGARSLFFKLNAKKEKFFYQREFSVLSRELNYNFHWFVDTVARTEERQNPLTKCWNVATRLAINGDEWSLAELEQLFFPKVSLKDSCSLSLSELILRDKEHIYSWLCVYSFTKDEHMIQELLKRHILIREYQLRHLLMNLCTCNNLSLLSKLEKEYKYFLSFEDKLHCLANYYLNSGDDKGLYTSLLEVMKEKRPLTRDTNIIFEIELYEVRELLKKEGIENPLVQNFM